MLVAESAQAVRTWLRNHTGRGHLPAKALQHVPRNPYNIISRGTSSNWWNMCSELPWSQSWGRFAAPLRPRASEVICPLSVLADLYNVPLFIPLTLPSTTGRALDGKPYS